jgi:acyl carrier protein
MATAARVLSDLQPLYREILDLPDLVLTASLTAKDVEVWDSFNHVRIISAAEQHFRIRLTAAEIEGLQTAGDLAALIATKIGP